MNIEEVYNLILKETGWYFMDFTFEERPYMRLQRNGKHCSITVELCFNENIKTIEDVIEVIKNDLNTTL